jgi:siroheme synthase-like protein
MSDPIDDGYAVVLRLRGRRVVVVGGGTIALRKVRGLLDAGAAVTVVAPLILDELRDLDSVALKERPYRSSDCDNAWLVVVATDDPAIQRTVTRDAGRRRIFVNSVDEPDLCSFILPAIARHGPVIVAVSTQGRSPSLAARLRDRLASALPDGLELLAESLASTRRQIRDEGRSTEGVDWADELAGV